MNWHTHSNLEGSHAFLGASKYHWVNYTEDKLIEAYSRYSASQMGTRYHALAAELITLGQKLPRSKRTFNMYVNDAIGFRMKPEQVLYYSDNCFGTADAISFKNGLLRIHDLKTGVVTPGNIKQLLIYAALFCLEYRVKPAEINMELRIYQNDEILVHNPEVDEVAPIIDKIITFDKLLNRIKTEEE